ncbi:MAG: heavy metal translocating P-type ATPase [Lactimicrobium sp.]|jgi:Cd2+/Zn2+-exporting ATPase|uniref:heavy metal translocating P-type ATPase n=1 Tax=Lactimicrobium sp. TaxID=2563780 RepID=UPI002F35CA1A
MQKWLNQNRDAIMYITGALTIMAFVTRIVFHQEAAAQLLFLTGSIVGGFPIAFKAIQAVRVKVISIDLLVTMAIAGAFVIQEYEESAAVSFLFLFGAWLEQRTLTKTRSAIKSLTEMAPETALVRQENGEFEETEIDEVDAGDVVLVKTGGKIPVDGSVILGSGSANEAGITGESIPVSKQKGDHVYAGSILANGTIQIEAEKVGEDTTFGRIIELVEEAQDSKSEAERFIDRFSRYYTPVVLAIGIITYLFTRNIELAVTILVLGCPGALVIGVPVSNVAGIGTGARHGILFKGSDVITRFSKVDTIFFDKTGTLTYGSPRLNRTISYDSDRQLAESLLVSVEKESDHPLAKAIIEAYPDVKIRPVEHTEVIQGGGIVAEIEGHHVLIGSQAMLEKYSIAINEQIKRDLKQLEQDGNSIVLTAVDGKLALASGIKDQIRSGVKEDLAALKKAGVKNLILLSGDNQETVDATAKELGLTQAYGQLLPQDKAEIVKKHQENGEIVAFVGDGINDSPSLALADIGIAMGKGTDVAIETSNVVLMNSDFHKIPYAITLARKVRANMIENIVIAIATVVVLLTGILAGSWMNMAIGMFVHEGSILVVILNAMRLLHRNHRKLDGHQFQSRTAEVN